MIQRIAIVGVGLIGGSLGLIWKKNRPECTIVGFDEPAVLDAAYRKNAIDERAASLEAAVGGADVVVLAVPIGEIVRLLEAVAPVLKPGAFVTDVGSVKMPVVDEAREVLPKEAIFIGGHPMAGSENSGIAHADAFLFENATYVLCPPEGMAETELAVRYPRFVDLIEATGGRALVLDAERHDRIAATVSHLPQLLAVSLMNYAVERNSDDDAFLRLAAGGFRDMTRIGSSPFQMWRDILIANHGPILDVLAGFATGLQKLRNRLAEEDLEALAELFTTCRQARETIPRHTKGFLHPLADLYVYAEDRPGELYAITRLLYESELNIKDIELLKIREGTGGAFRIGFADDATAGRAAEALQASGYTAYRL